MFYNENNKLFKPVTYNCFMNIAQFNIYDIIIPANSMIYIDTCETTMYICTHFPNYAGDPENVTLRVLWYDYEMRTIGDTFLHNDISVNLFCAWINASKPRTKKIIHKDNFSDYENMMRHSRRKKSGSGGVRIMKNCDYTTDNLRYKQVTEPAYWANLNNAKSGNASVVASSIR